jgi:predicted RNA binding protein YcfA (HicA-like mRNA interferase family)
LPSSSGRAWVAADDRDAAGRGNGVIMSSILPVLSGREVVRVFEDFGWEVVRQSASHIIMVKEGEQATLSIPDHREVARGTLRSLIRTAGLTVQEFVSGIR